MLFGTLAALRKSDVYRRLGSLRAMPVFRQERFREVFNRLFDSLKRHGAVDDVAEANASALALVAAERFIPTPKTASVEAEEHWFATMAEHQFSREGQVEINDFSFVRSHLDLLNAAIAGNAFNLDHKHTEPTGEIRRLELPEDAPAHVRERFPEAPFFVVASYYEDTSDEIRSIDTVSAEWSHFPRQPDGSTVVFFPDTFASTKEPATGPMLGVGKAAAWEAEKVYQGAGGLDATGTSMPGETDTKALTAKVAALEKERDDALRHKTQLEELQTKYASLEERHKETVAKVASIAGIEPQGDKPPAEAEVISGLTEKVASLSKEMEAVNQKLATKEVEMLRKEAEVWAENLVKTKEGLAMDAKEKFAAMYQKDPEMASSIGETLKDKVLAPGREDAVANLETLDDEKSEKRLEFIKGAF